MSLQELAKSICFDNASKGFDPEEGGLERYLLLVISEICEAQEELRDGKDVNNIYYSVQAGYPNHGQVKPCGFPVEIADAIIRILDIQAKLELEIRVVTDIYWIKLETTIDKELLAIVSVISECFRNTTNKENNLNLALSGLFQLSYILNIDIMKVIDKKLAFNRSRPPKHGRKF